MAEQEFRIHIVSDADNTGFKSAADASDDLATSAKKSAAATEDASKSAGHSEINHRALHRTLEKLNEVVPGLGTAVTFLSHGLQAESAAAEGAAAANDEVLVSMGELAIVFLTIQAAAQYWELYKESSKAALEEQTKASEKLDEATKKMIESRDKFNEAMERGIDPAERISKQLDLQTKIVQAQITAERELLKAREETELAGAQTPEQKDAIKKRYQAALDQNDDNGDAAKTNLITQAKLKAQRQQEQLQGELDELNARQLALTHGADKQIPAQPGQVVPQFSNGYQLPDKVIPGSPARIEHQAPSAGDLDAAAKLAPKIEEVQKQILSLKNAQENYGDTIDESKTVGAINRSGRFQAENPVLSAGVKSIDAGAHGEAVTKEMAASNNALTQLFAAHAGGLKQMTEIVKYHLQHSTSQDSEIQALKTALVNLQQQTRSMPGQSR